MKVALLLVVALIGCRPRQAAPADRLEAWSDGEGIVHVGERPRPKDARLWKSGEEDPHRIGSRCFDPKGAEIACRD